MPQASSAARAGRSWTHIRELNRIYEKMETEGEHRARRAAHGRRGARERTLVSRRRRGGASRPRQLPAADRALRAARATGERWPASSAAKAGSARSCPSTAPTTRRSSPPVAAMVERIYGDMQFSPPKIPLYSCATAAPMPRLAEAIRELAARAVALARALHRDDPADVRRRVPHLRRGRAVVEPDRLHRKRAAGPGRARRVARQPAALQPGSAAACRRAAVDGRARSSNSRRALRRSPDPRRGSRHAGSRRNRGRGSSRTRLPFLRLPEDQRAAIREALRRGASQTSEHGGRIRASRGSSGAAPRRSSPGLPKASPGPRPATSRSPSRLCIPPAARPQHDDAIRAAGGRPAPAICVSGHFALMQQFLDMQSRVMTPDGGRSHASAADGEPRPYPFLHRILVHDADAWSPNATSTSTTTSSSASTSSMRCDVSDLDPRLTALPVVPLAVSIEMLAEAASALAPAGSSRCASNRCGRRTG